MVTFLKIIGVIIVLAIAGFILRAILPIIEFLLLAGTVIWFVGGVIVALVVLVAWIGSKLSQ